MTRQIINPTAAALIALGVGWAATAQAQSPNGTTNGPVTSKTSQDVTGSGNPIFIDKSASPTARAAAVSALAAKASANGSVRVIAGLRLALKPPADLSDTDATAQEGALRAVQDSLARRVGASEVVNFDYIPFVSMFVNSDQVRSLAADDAVVNIQEDVPEPPSLLQSVPFINADDVWAAGFPGTGITVAILDTGVDKTHDMFPAGRVTKIASEACYSTTTGGATPSLSVCPGGVAASTAVNSGVNCSTAVNGCNHGTHVAGIAAGNMTSTTPDLRGVARNSRIIAIQVFSRFNGAGAAGCGSSPAPCVLSYTTDQIKGLERVFALRNTFTIAAANMSLGGGQFLGPCDSTNAARKAAIDNLRSARIATVIASGNSGFNGTMGAPACISSAIAVGSTLDTANTLSSFSNHADNVRLLAPGSNIVSSVPDTTVPLQATASFNGTSMATPHVTGAWALLKDVRSLSTVDDISAALECTGVAVTRAGITERRIDVNAARAYLLAPPNATVSNTFSAAAEAAQWTPFIGTWSIAGGVYQPSTATSGWKLSTRPNCNENVTITSRLRRIWGASQMANAGIVFKTQLSTTNRTMSGYMAAINRDLGSDTAFNVVLWRFHQLNLATESGGATQLLCNKDLDPIVSGTFYTLKVVSTGGIHRVYVNNVLQCSAVDRTFGTGRAGLITFVGTPSAGNAFQADNFVIDPNETVPASDEIARAE